MKHLLYFLLLLTLGLGSLYLLIGSFLLPQTSKKVLIPTLKESHSTPITIALNNNASIELDRRLKIEGSKTRYTDREGKRLADIHLETGKPDPQEEYFLGTKPSIRIYREGRFKDTGLGETWITAENCKLNNEYSKGFLSGNVKIVIQDTKNQEVLLQTDSLFIDIEKREIHTDSPVSIQAEELSLEAEGFEAGLYIEEARLFKNVVLTLKNIQGNLSLETTPPVVPSPNEQTKNTVKQEPPVTITCKGNAVLRRKTKRKDQESEPFPPEEQPRDIQISFYEKVQVLREETQFFCDQLDLKAQFNDSSKSKNPSPFKFLEKHLPRTHSTLTHFFQTLEGSSKILLSSEATEDRKIKPLLLQGVGNVRVLDKQGSASAHEILWSDHPHQEMQKISLKGNPKIDFKSDKKFSLLVLGDPSKNTSTPPPVAESGLLKIYCKDQLEYHRHSDGLDSISAEGEVDIQHYNEKNVVENVIRAQTIHLGFQRETVIPMSPHILWQQWKRSLEGTKEDRFRQKLTLSIYWGRACYQRLNAFFVPVKTPRSTGKESLDPSLKIRYCIAKSKVFIKDSQGEVSGDELYYQTQGKDRSFIRLVGQPRIVFETEENLEWNSLAFSSKKPNSEKKKKKPAEKILQTLEAECKKELIVHQIHAQLRKIYLEEDVRVTHYYVETPRQATTLSCKKLFCALSFSSSHSDIQELLAEHDVNIQNVEGKVHCQKLSYHATQENLCLEEGVFITGEAGEASCHRLLYDLKSEKGTLIGDDQKPAQLSQTVLMEQEKALNFLRGNQIQFLQKDSYIQQLTALGSVYAQIYPKEKINNNLLPTHFTSRMNSGEKQPWLVHCDKLRILFDKPNTPSSPSAHPEKIESLSSIFDKAKQEPQKILAKGRVQIFPQNKETRIQSEAFEYDLELGKVVLSSKNSKVLFQQGKEYLECSHFEYDQPSGKARCKGQTKATFIATDSKGKKNTLFMKCRKGLLYSNTENTLQLLEDVLVRVDEEDFRIKAKEMKVTLNAKQKPETIEAYHHVKIRQKNLNGSGDYGIWNTSQQRADLRDNVYITKEAYSAAGEHLIWFAEERRAQLQGNPVKLSQNSRSNQYIITPELNFRSLENENFEVETPKGIEIRFLPRGTSFKDLFSSPSQEQK